LEIDSLDRVRVASARDEFPADDEHDVTDCRERRVADGYRQLSDRVER
jgi:hypothetical protein